MSRLARRAILGPKSGAPPAPVADLLLDFANGVYRKDGVTGSFASLGGVLTGSPSITSAGLLCATGESASIAYNMSGDLICVVDYAIPAGGGAQRAFRYTDADSDPYIEVVYGGGNILGQIMLGGSSAQNLGSIFGSSKVATGYCSGAFRSSKNGGAVSVSSFGSAPVFTSGTMIAGNDAVSGTNFWDGRVRSVAIYKGTFSDAQIQALST